MKKVLAALLLAMLPPAGIVVTVAALDRTIGYRSPQAGGVIADPPRLRSELAFAEWLAAREAEARARAELLADLTTDKMIQLGKEIVHGRGLCFNCHRIGSAGHGTQGPDLAGVGGRAGQRVAGLDATTYLSQSLYHPEVFVVDGYTATMIPADQPPIGLSDLEILFVISYLQSLGGEVTVTPDTEVPVASGGGAP